MHHSTAQPCQQNEPPGCDPTDLLLKTFRGSWAMTLHKPPPTPDMAAAPLQPLVAVVERAGPPGSPSPKPVPVKLTFKASEAGPDAQQMQSIVKVCWLPR